MKKIYFLNEEEKNIILNLHQNAIKRQYLGEQPESRFETQYNKELMSKNQNNTSKAAANKAAANKAAANKAAANKAAADKAAADKAAADKAAADKKTIEDKAKKAQQYKQQIITKTKNNTIEIQKLLGLEQTGVMDTGLLQLINSKLKGETQQPRQKLEPINLTAAGVTTSTLKPTSDVTAPTPVTKK
jgi:hypothetical protein